MSLQNWSFADAIACGHVNAVDERELVLGYICVCAVVVLFACH